VIRCPPSECENAAETVQNLGVFVHASALERSGLAAPLAEGQAVTVRVVPGRRGPEAETVRGA
jgi:cold shock CspA family protein